MPVAPTVLQMLTCPWPKIPALVTAKLRDDVYFIALISTTQQKSGCLVTAFQLAVSDAGYGQTKIVPTSLDLL